MPSDELPPGFHFERYIDGPGLYYREHVVANASPANYRPDPPYRIAINPNSIHRRFEFTDTEAEAVRYMAAWARKWEKRIIEEVISLNPPKVASTEPKEPPPQTTHPRRHSRRAPRIFR